MVTLYVVVLCIVLQLGPTPDPKIITCYGNWAMQHFKTQHFYLLPRK